VFVFVKINNLNGCLHSYLRAWLWLSDCVFCVSRNQC